MADLSLVVRPLRTTPAILYTGRAEKMCEQGARGIICDQASDFERNAIRKFLSGRSKDRWLVTGWQPCYDNRKRVFTYSFDIFVLDDVEGVYGFIETLPKRTREIEFRTMPERRSLAFLRGINYRISADFDYLGIDYTDADGERRVISLQEDADSQAVEFMLRFG